MSGAEQRRTITIARHVRTLSNAHGSLYYFFGNFFKPLDLHGSEVGFVKREIRKFLKENAAMVKADRTHKDYMTLPQMMDVKPYNEVPGDCP